MLSFSKTKYSFILIFKSVHYEEDWQNVHHHSVCYFSGFFFYFFTYITTVIWQIQPIKVVKNILRLRALNCNENKIKAQLNAKTSRMYQYVIKRCWTIFNHFILLNINCTITIKFMWLIAYKKPFILHPKLFE